MIKLLLLSVIATLAMSMPAKEVLDKATVNDVALNDINGDKKIADVNVVTVKEGISPSSVDIIIEPSTVPTITPNLRPQRVGSAFARIIDDIFQIPITVLQSVSRLLTNPFLGGHKTPETASGY